MVTLGGFCRWGDKGSDAHLGVEGDGLAADLVETLHPNDVARDHDDGREEAALVRVARHDLERAPSRLGGTRRHRGGRDLGAHRRGGLEAHAARLDGRGEGEGTGDGGHVR
jgi:hypothetical protein